jgi:hypothetical protein
MHATAMKDATAWSGTRNVAVTKGCNSLIQYKECNCDRVSGIVHRVLGKETFWAEALSISMVEIHSEFLATNLQLCVLVPNVSLNK